MRSPSGYRNSLRASDPYILNHLRRFACESAHLVLPALVTLFVRLRRSWRDSRMP
jgi:hypothetical protein